MPPKKAEGTGRHWKQLQYLPVFIHQNHSRKTGGKKQRNIERLKSESGKIHGEKLEFLSWIVTGISDISDNSSVYFLVLQDFQKNNVELWCLPVTPGEPVLPASLWGCSMPCFVSRWDGGHSLGCWNTGKSREHRECGSVVSLLAGGDSGTFLDNGSDSCAPCVRGRLKAGGDSGLHETGGECSCSKRPWKTRCSLVLDCSEFPPGWFRVFLKALGRMR